MKKGILWLVITISACDTQKKVDNNNIDQKIGDLSYNGIQNLKKGNFGEADKLYDSICKINPNNEIAYYYKSEIYKYKGKYDSSIYYISKAIDLNSVSPTYFESRAGLNFDNGNLEAAIVDIQKAYHLSSKSVRICRSYASFLSHKDDFRGALTYSFEALKLDSNNYNIYFDIATLFVNIKKLDSSVYYSSKGLMLNDNASELYRIRGEAYFKSKRYDLACIDFKKVIYLSNASDFEVVRIYSKHCK
jgi:tetratricopeptide (TPR) repeat protein